LKRLPNLMIPEKIDLAARRPAAKWLTNATSGHDSCFSRTKNFAKNNVRLGVRMK